MDWGIILGAIGTLATIVFGVLSIDLFKRRRYPGRITYIKLSAVDLLDSVAKNFDEIKITHMGSPVSKSLVYVKGALINNGDIDINAKSVAANISIDLPVNCKWIDIKATKCSKNLYSKASIMNSSKAEIDFDLFKRDEYLQFEGIVEGNAVGDNADSIDAAMHFTHRIENVAEIEKKVLPSEKEIKSRKSEAAAYLIMLPVMIVAIAIAMAYDVYFLRKPLFFRESPDTTGIYFEALKNGDSIQVVAKNADAKKVISFQAFEKEFRPSKDDFTVFQKLKDGYFAVLLPIGMLIAIVLLDLLQTRSVKRIAKILKE